MGISLYISRVVLDVLGAVDYGLYNVIGGVVIMFGFLNNAMAASTQRFLTFEIGRGNRLKLKQIFSTSINLHVLISIIILLLSETIGLWFLNAKLNIPSDRVIAANWVYQFSLLSALIQILSVPYHALIIAHEKMNVFAGISILEVLLKLFAVFLLKLYGDDKLILYAILIFAVSFLIRIIYSIYCSKKFKESRFMWFWDKNLFREMTSFAGWNLFGVFAGIGYNQGVNILLNIFFNPIVNAARAISFQVTGAINQLVTNFQLAVNPPIIKSYAEKRDRNTNNIIFASSKFSYFLLLLFVVPLVIEMEFVLSIWLKEVPEYTVLFTRLILIDALIMSLSGPLQTLAQATGRIRNYQLIVSSILLLNLPISYILLYLNFQPESTFIVSIVLSIVALISRLMVLKRIANFPVFEFVKNVLVIVLAISILTIALPSFTYNLISNHYLQFLLTFFSVAIPLLLSVWFIAVSKSQKKIIVEYIIKSKNRYLG